MGHSTFEQDQIIEDTMIEITKYIEDRMFILLVKNLERDIRQLEEFIEEDKLVITPIEKAKRILHRKRVILTFLKEDQRQIRRIKEELWKNTKTIWEKTSNE